MAGDLAIPNVIQGLGGQQPASVLDQNWNAIRDYVNPREITSGLLSARPPAGVRGRWYYVTDGPALCFDTGTAWLVVGAPAAAQRGYLAGLQLARNAGTPTTALDISAGVCTSDDGAVSIRFPGTLTGTTGGTFVQGAGQPKLDAGAIGNDQWWHVFAIAGGPFDYDMLFSLSATAPTLPAGYTVKRRLGAFRTDGAAAILAFVQDGDYFAWDVPFGDVNDVDPGVAAVLRTLTVPPGVNVFALFNAFVQKTSAGATHALFTDPATGDTSAAVTGSTPIVEGGSIQGGFAALSVRTDTSGRVRSRLFASDANTTLVVTTLGWLDRRGQDA